MTFADFLIRKRDEINLTNSKLAVSAKISAVYLGEIIKQKKMPPDKKTQIALANALRLSDEDKIIFFDLAAAERLELPSDINDFLYENNDLIKEIRTKFIYSNGRCGKIIPIRNSVLAKAHTPQYKMHKYFARRPYNVFQNLIEHYSQKDDIILDCFCGGGVTVFESVSLKRKAIGVDINPLATFITRMQLFNGDYELLKSTYTTFIKQIKEKYEDYYFISFDDDDGICEWVEWISEIRCPICNEIISLTEDQKITNAIFKCPNSKCVNNQGVKRVDGIPKKALPIRVKYHSRIENKVKIRDINPNQLKNVEYEKVLKNLNNKPNFIIPLDWDRQHEDKLKERGVTEYKHFFTDRNYAINCCIFNDIINLKEGLPLDIYEMLYFLFSSSLRYTNKMARVSENWEGGKPTAMDKHAFWLPNQFIETNILDIIEKRVKSILSGVKYTKSVIAKNVLEASNFEDLSKDANYWVLNKSSTDLPIPNQSIDVVITDPPYGSNVQYAELSVIWNAWYNLFNNLDGYIFNAEEAVVNRKRKIKGAKTEADYENLLFSVFSECSRVLKPNGYLIFTFNNKNIKVWIAMMRAVARAGFYLPDNGVIFQDFIKSYKNTSHLRYAGNIHGDFIYSFVKGENPAKQILNGYSLKEIIEISIEQSISVLFSSQKHYTTTELYQKIFSKLVGVLMAYISEHLNDIDEMMKLEKYSDDYVDLVLKKYLVCTNGVWGQK